MQKHSGIITETPVMNSEKRDVVSLQKGDYVYLAGQKVYGVISDFKKAYNGEWNVRLVFPKDAVKFQRWCEKNPHRVKRFETGKFIPKGGS